MIKVFSKKKYLKDREDRKNRGLFFIGDHVGDWVNDCDGKTLSACEEMGYGISEDWLIDVEEVRSLVDDMDVKAGETYEVVRETSLGNGDGIWVIDDAGDEFILLGNEYEIIEESLKDKYLVTGNVVELRNGELFLIVNNSLMSEETTEYIDFENVRDDMTGKFFHRFDIMVVYEPIRFPCSFRFALNRGNLKAIWRR